MEIARDKNFNQTYIRNGCSVGLSGLSAVYGTKVLNMASAKANSVILNRVDKNIRDNNEVYKNASKIVLKREKIRFADLSVTKNAFGKGADPEFNKIIQQQSKTITAVLNSSISGLLKLFKSNKKIKQERSLKIQSYYEGNNACSIYNKVFVNFERGAFMIPHEMGHVKNFESKGLAKCLQKMREPWFNKIGLGLAFGAAIFLPPIKDDKVSDKEQNFSTKTNNFVKNNCVKIGTVAVLPVILEEGLASLKAHKLMKDLIPKSDLKLMNKSNLVAFLSYIIGNSAIVGGIYIADKVRNFTAPKNKSVNNVQ